MYSCVLIIHFCIHIFKSSLTLLQYCLFYVLVFWGMWDHSCLTNNWTCTACIGRQSLNHWTTRKFLSIYLKKCSYCDWDWTSFQASESFELPFLWTVLSFCSFLVDLIFCWYLGGLCLLNDLSIYVYLTCTYIDMCIKICVPYWLWGKHIFTGMPRLFLSA